MKNLKKSKIYALLALILLFSCFCLPAVLFKGLKQRAIEEPSKIANIIYPLYSLYTKNSYYSLNNDKKIKGDLRAQIKASNELGMISLPIWAVSLSAPQYPKSIYPVGVPVFFHFDGYSGEVREMNTINHYVGMYSMEYGAPYVKVLSPYALVMICLGIFLFIIYAKKWLSYFLLASASLPLVFLAIYTYWLYFYGHNMHSFGSFRIKAFMPTVFGEGKVAQFSTYSYPSIGFYILIIISIFSLLAFFSFKKNYKNT